jgi:hypothetical protein
MRVPNLSRERIKRRLDAEIDRLRVAIRQPLVVLGIRHPTSQLLRWLSGVDPEVARARRIEVGSGLLPRPGYLHIDRDGSLPDLQLSVSAERLPVPAGWARELLAIHVLEHVPAQQVAATLAEWWRVLEPGGALEIHVPNGLVIARLLADANGPDQFWPLQNAIFGYWAGASTTDPTRFPGPPDHKILFTPTILQTLLCDAGFSVTEDVSGRVECRHQEEWAITIPGLCLEVSAQK